MNLAGLQLDKKGRNFSKWDVWNLLNWSEFSFKETRLTWWIVLIGHRIKYSSCIHTGRRIKWQSNYLDLHENNLSGGGGTQDRRQRHEGKHTVYVGRIAVYSIYWDFLWVRLCLCVMAKPLTLVFMMKLMTEVDIWVHKSFLTQPSKEPAMHSSA